MKDEDQRVTRMLCITPDYCIIVNKSLLLFENYVDFANIEIKITLLGWTIDFIIIWDMI